MSDVTAASSTASSSASGAATTGLMGNYELFLTLLTTRVTNQDPLEPMDSAEYTNQLVQYSAVEQSIQTNQHLENILASFESSRASSYVSYLGQEVTASGTTSMLRDGSASWDYSLKEAAGGVVEVRNASGGVVYREEVSLEAGEGSWLWDGQTSSGSQADEGAYSISFDVYDASGNAETVQTEISGIVDEVHMDGGAATLKIGTVEIPVDAVSTVKSVSV